MVGFGTAIANGFRNYVNFTGRSTRAEYWWWQLFNFIVAFVLTFVDAAIFGVSSVSTNDALGYGYHSTDLFSNLWTLAVLLPSLALLVRRIRDAGYHWAWVFLCLFPIAALVFALLPTNETERNQHSQPTYRDNRRLTVY